MVLVSSVSNNLQILRGFRFRKGFVIFEKVMTFTFRKIYLNVLISDRRTHVHFDQKFNGNKPRVCGRNKCSFVLVSLHLH